MKSTFDLENELISAGYHILIGIDEAGRGPLAGPIVASAVALRNLQFLIYDFQTNLKVKNIEYRNQYQKNWELIRDSKSLSSEQREKLFDFIHEHFYVGVGICDHKTIDRINILEASFLAMKSAFTDLKLEIKSQNEKLRSMDQNYFNEKCIALIDGNKLISNFSFKQKAIVNGDKIVKSISAASIIAKVVRDRMMLEMHAKYPQYNFDENKGYGTKKHMDALRRYGPCEIHRRSFNPVKKLAKKRK